MQTRVAAAIWSSLLLFGCQSPDRRQPSMAAQPATLVCAGFVGSGRATSFDDCVAFQQARDPGPSVPPFRMDQYDNRVDAQGYAVDSWGRRMPVQSPYYALPGQAGADQGTLRDEYGNRYDFRGNRIN